MPQPHQPDSHREKSIDAHAIVWTGIALLATVAVVVAAVFLWRAASSLRPAAAQPVPIAPEAPRLQTTPLADRHAYEQEKRQLLESYAWVDRSAGVTRIPIEHAMQLLTERAQADRTRR